MRNVKDGEVKKLEYHLQTAKGMICIRNRSKVFKRDAKGTPTHVLSILQDITHEVQLRNQLEERTQYAETIIDASVDQIFVLDTSFRIIAWNKKSEEKTGVKKETAIGRNFFDLFPKLADDTLIHDSYQDAMAGHYVQLPPKKAIYSGGVYERFYIPLKNAEGKTHAVLTIVHDISGMVSQSEELKELNKTLKQKNKELEQKNEEITHFSFVASHDLKEPLRKIHIFSNWLLEQEAEHLTDAGKSYAAKIAEAVKRMEWLIEDILVLTKIHSDKYNKDDVDLNEVLGDVKQDMAEQLLQTKATIEAVALPQIKGNKNQVFYLFKNIISNAIKFQHPDNKPQIKITSSVVKEKEGQTDEPVHKFLKLSFADNGFGFDSKYAKKIFQVFQRLHGRYEFEGTGIGLAICKKIMDNHHGFITADSEEGKGAVFHCYFPVL